MDKKSFLLGTLTGVMTRGQVFVTPRESLTKIPYQNALFLRVLPWARETIGLSARFCLCIKIFRRILTRILRIIFN